MPDQEETDQEEPVELSPSEARWIRCTPPKYLDQHEAALYLGVSRSHVRDHTRPRGRIKCIRFGRRTLYRPADLDEFMESHLSA